MQRTHPITRWLERAPTAAFSAYAIAAAFTVYFCMYAFRKPFTVGAFDSDMDLGIGEPVSMKTVLIISQVVGYAASKFLGIKVISEMSAAGRALAILGFIGFSEVALALLALLPLQWAPLCLFLNGLPLGMVWGLVFGFLEGRRTSELLGAGLSASYILASGGVKTVAKLWMEQGISEQVMPFVTGLTFAPILLVAVWALSKLPPPSAEDVALRSERAPMDGKARAMFFGRYFIGLTALTVLYVPLTAYRSYRDDFAAEIWAGLGYTDAAVFTAAETPVTLGVLASLAVIMLIKDNRRALLVIHLVMLAGAALMVGATALFQAGLLPGAAWMVLVGLGAYLAYVPYGCVLFDRLFAALAAVGTAGFLIYVTDAFGYVGSIAVMLYKDFAEKGAPPHEFLQRFTYLTGAVAFVLLLVSTVYFERVARSFAREEP